jgi:lysophospholipase L1-like esterase
MNYFKINIIFITMLLLLIAKNNVAQNLTQQQKWEQKLEKYRKQDSIKPPHSGNILFLGSSTIENWKTLEHDFAEKKAINRGVSGTKMIDLFNYKERLIDPYNPEKIFIYEGDNDIALGWSADSITKVFKELFYYIRSKKPDATIYVISIKPSPAREKHIVKLLKTNELLEQFISEQKNAGYIDVYNPMLVSGKLVPAYYRPDNLHLTEEGYEVWKQVIGAYINQ